MSEDQKPESTIVDELAKLGKQVADALKTGWESEDRVRLQREISEGLKKFGEQVEEAVTKAADSVPTEKIVTQAEKVVAEVRESDIAGQVRRGILKGLETVNLELGRWLEKLEEQKAAGPASADVPAPAEVQPDAGLDAESAEPPVWAPEDDTAAMA